MSHPDPAALVAERIKDYLCAGGLFNPERMEHDKVRALIMDCRDLIESQSQQIADLHEARRQRMEEMDRAERAVAGLMAGRDRLRAALSELWSNVRKQHWEPEFYERMANLTEWHTEALAGAGALERAP